MEIYDLKTQGDLNAAQQPFLSPCFYTISLSLTMISHWPFCPQTHTFSLVLICNWWYCFSLHGGKWSNPERTPTAPTMPLLPLLMCAHEDSASLPVTINEPPVLLTLHLSPRLSLAQVYQPYRTYSSNSPLFHFTNLSLSGLCPKAYIYVVISYTSKKSFTHLLLSLPPHFSAPPAANILQRDFFYLFPLSLIF